jgi:hypothetical protein
MTWIRLDPQELAAQGAHLRDVALSLEAASRRIDAACCAPGLGRHARPLMSEGRSVAAWVVAVTEGYLRQAIDIVQRAISALQDAQLASTVGGVGSVAAGIIGGSVVGGATSQAGFGTPSLGTVGGLAPAVMSAIPGGGRSAMETLGLGGGFVGGSWSTTATDAGGAPGLRGLDQVLTAGSGPSLRPRASSTAERWGQDLFIQGINAQTMRTSAANLAMASSIGAPSTATVAEFATTRGLTFTPDYGQRR